MNLPEAGSALLSHHKKWKEELKEGIQEQEAAKSFSLALYDSKTAFWKLNLSLKYIDNFLH